MFPKKHQLKGGTSLKITYKAFGNGLTLNACKEMLTQTEKAGAYFLGKLDYFRDMKSKNFGYSARLHDYRIFRKPKDNKITQAQ